MPFSLRYQMMAFSIFLFVKVNGAGKTGDFEKWRKGIMTDMAKVEDWLTHFQKMTKGDRGDLEKHDSDTNSEFVDKCGSVGSGSVSDHSGPASARGSPPLTSALVLSDTDVSDAAPDSDDSAGKRRRRSFTELRRGIRVPSNRWKKSSEREVRRPPKFWTVIQNVFDTSKNWDDQERAQRLREGVYNPSKHVEMTKQLLSYTSGILKEDLMGCLKKVDFKPSNGSIKHSHLSKEQELLRTFAEAKDEKLVEKAENLLKKFARWKENDQVPSTEDTETLRKIQREVQLVMLTRIDALATLLEKKHADDPNFVPRTHTLLMTVGKMEFLGQHHFLVPLNTRLMIAAQHYVCDSWNDDS